MARIVVNANIRSRLEPPLEGIPKDALYEVLKGTEPGTGVMLHHAYAQLKEIAATADRRTNGGLSARNARAGVKSGPSARNGGPTVRHTSDADLSWTFSATGN
jgi:hypothetical protein